MVCSDLLNYLKTFGTIVVTTESSYDSLNVIFIEQFPKNASFFCFFYLCFVWSPQIFQIQAKNQKYRPCFKAIFPFLISMKKGMSIAIYVNIYTSVTIYGKRKTQNQNNLVNSILQFVSFVQKNCWVVYPASELPHLILCVRECQMKTATTYLAIRAKSN